MPTIAVRQGKNEYFKRNFPEGTEQLENLLKNGLVSSGNIFNPDQKIILLSSRGKSGNENWVLIFDLPLDLVVSNSNKGRIRKAFFGHGELKLSLEAPSQDGPSFDPSDAYFGALITALDDANVSETKIDLGFNTQVNLKRTENRAGLMKIHVSVAKK